MKKKKEKKLRELSNLLKRRPCRFPIMRGGFHESIGLDPAVDGGEL
jgi:hypothetical protein